MVFSYNAPAHPSVTGCQVTRLTGYQVKTRPPVKMLKKHKFMPEFVLFKTWSPVNQNHENRELRSFEKFKFNLMQIERARNFASFRSRTAASPLLCRAAASCAVTSAAAFYDLYENYELVPIIASSWDINFT